MAIIELILEALFSFKNSLKKEIQIKYFNTFKVITITFVNLVSIF